MSRSTQPRASASPSTKPAPTDESAPAYEDVRGEPARWWASSWRCGPDPDDAETRRRERREEA
jgi:hypothetical protein